MLPGIGYAAGMTSLLESRDIRVFDDTKWAEPLREAIRSNAETIAASAGINERAQALADDFDWSLMQVEYSTNIVFRHQMDLAPIDETLARTSVVAVKPEHVATFLGRTLHGHYRTVEHQDGTTKFKLGPCARPSTASYPICGSC